MKELEDERKRKKREYDRMRRERMKSDPVIAEQMKEKERKKYKKKLETKQIKLAKDMTPRELRLKRKLWRGKFRKWYGKKKEMVAAILPPATPASTPSELASPSMMTPRAQHIASIAKRRVWRHHKQLQNKVKFLKEENKKLRQRSETLRKRIYRQKIKQKANGSELSPRKTVNNLIKHGCLKTIRQKLLVGESLNRGLGKAYRGMDQREKATFRNRFHQNAHFLKKYKLLNQMNFISSKLLYRNFVHRSNNRIFRNRCNRLADQVKRDVTDFFEEDENSALCPGKKDCVTRKGVKKQKRYLTGNLKKLHKKFCNTHSFKLSYAMFCKLRPFWVVTPKVTDRDTCICKTHENMKELASALHKKNVTYSADIDQIVSSICCDRSSSSCLERKCSGCKDILVSYQQFEDGEIEYKQWVSKTETYTSKKSTEKKTAKHVVKDHIKSTIHQTVDLFEKQLREFMIHESVMIHGFRSIRYLKSRLLANEVLIHCDFSENYNTKYGREIQSVHFGGSRKQVTLHAVQMYFRKSASDLSSSQAFCTLEIAPSPDPCTSTPKKCQPSFDMFFPNV